jgi:uncharacterized protein YgiM (DUF1202 family)
MKPKKNLAVVGLSLSACILLITLAIVFPVEGAVLDATTTPSAAGPCAPPITGIVVADRLSIRLAPVVTSLATIFVVRDDVITILGQDNNTDWLWVMTNAGIPGWAASPYVFVDKKKLPLVPKLGTVTDLLAQGPVVVPTQSADQSNAVCTPTPNAGPFDGIVVSSGLLHVYEKPLQNAKIIGNVRRNDTVRVIAWNTSETWLKIQAGDLTGWVSSAYVFVSKALQPQIPHDFTYSEVTLTPSPTLEMTATPAK